MNEIRGHLIGGGRRLAFGCMLQHTHKQTHIHTGTLVSLHKECKDAYLVLKKQTHAGLLSFCKLMCVCLYVCAYVCVTSCLRGFLRQAKHIKVSLDISTDA